MLEIHLHIEIKQSLQVSCPKQRFYSLQYPEYLKEDVLKS